MVKKNKQEDIDKYLQFLNRVKREVDSWPDYMKTSGRLTHQWSFPKKSKSNGKVTKPNIQPQAEASP